MTNSADVRMHRRRIILGVTALALVGATASTYFLAGSSTTTIPSASTPQGVAAGGVLSTFSAMSPGTVSVVQGQGAQKISGVYLGKVKVAAGFASKLRVDVAWLDPQDAGKVLSNPNAWITFELDYPIHTGLCTGADPTGSVNITDTIALCAAPNSSASGPLTFNGRLTINPQMLSGFLLENAMDPASPSTCVSTGTTWCAPSGVGLAVNQNIFYITSSIHTPGGIVPGQQGGLTTLSFYLGAHTL